jgi:hypothetical protein
MANSFTRPPRVVGGNKQAISAKDFNGLSRAIEELQNAIRPAGPKSKKRGNAQADPFWTTVSAVPDSDPVSYQASVTTGYLCYQNATLSESDDGVVGYLVPRIRNADGELESIESDGTPEWVSPKLPLEGLVNYIYLRVKTDADGAPKAPTAPAFPGDPGAADGPTIEAFEEPQQSIHHVRPSPSGGEEEGDYFFLICETESNGATPTPAPRVVRRITGNRELPNQLIEIANIGDKREWYQGYKVGPDDKHEFRTAEQLDGGGAPIIKPLEDDEEEGDTIKWRDVKKNNSDSVPYTIRGEGDSVKVTFAGLDGPYVDAFGGQINFAAGIAVDTQGGAFNGWWGTVQWVSLSGSQSIELHFQNGILVRASGDAVDVVGTENAPGTLSRAF